MKQAKPQVERITQNPLYLFVFIPESLAACFLLVTQLHE
jgi:hypothetical protein